MQKLHEWNALDFAKTSWMKKALDFAKTSWKRLWTFVKASWQAFELCFGLQYKKHSWKPALDFLQKLHAQSKKLFWNLVAKNCRWWSCFGFFAKTSSKACMGFFAKDFMIWATLEFASVCFSLEQTWVQCKHWWHGLMIARKLSSFANLFLLQQRPTKKSFVRNCNHQLLLLRRLAKTKYY